LSIFIGCAIKCVDKKRPSQLGDGLLFVITMSFRRYMCCVVFGLHYLSKQYHHSIRAHKYSLIPKLRYEEYSV